MEKMSNLMSSKKRKRDVILVESDDSDDGNEPNTKEAKPKTKSKTLLPLTNDEIERFRVKYRKSSEFSLIKKKMQNEFLRSRVFRDRDEAIAHLHTNNPKAAVIYRFLFHKFTAKQIQRFWSWAQRSEPWFKSRFGSRTGSEGGYLCNWNPYKNAIRFAFEKYWFSFKGNPATEHGSKTEKLAAKIYANYVQTFLNKWFVQQKGFDTGVFIYRGKTIPLFKRKPTDKYYAPPVFKCRHIGGVRDPFNHQDQCSIDLEGFINDIPVVVGEIKVPWAEEQFFLYENEKLYYVPQPADGIRHMQRLWPSTFCADRITFSHLYGLNSDLFVQDPHWYNDWFIPRSLRYYFGPHMEIMCEFIYKLFKYVYPNEKLTPETLREFLHKQYFVPEMETEEQALRNTKTKFETLEIEENEIEFEQQLKYAKQYTVQFGVFPEPKSIIKSHDVYFSEMRMIPWRAKTVSLDQILRHRLHTKHTPSFGTLLRHNRTYSIWKDEESHFGRTFDEDSVMGNLTPDIVEEQSDYVAMFGKHDRESVQKFLECETRYRFDFYWCVFVAGHKIVSPSSKNLRPNQTIHFSNLKDDGSRELYPEDTETVTIPSLEINDQFVASAA
jgi:hypothetical protein